MACEAGVGGHGLLYREVCPERLDGCLRVLAGCIPGYLFRGFRAVFSPGLRANIFPERRCGFAIVLHSDFAGLRLVRSFVLNSNGALSFDRVDLCFGWNRGSDPGEESGLAFPYGFERFARVFSWMTLAVKSIIKPHG